MSGIILAVDPGEKRIGIALSDATATLARPLTIIKHVARADDAASIVQIAGENNAVKIIIGIPLDQNGNVGAKARRSERLANQIRMLTELPVELWDESGSTITARKILQIVKGKKKGATGDIDDIAASVILQSYLDAYH